MRSIEVKIKDSIRNRHPEKKDGLVGEVSLYNQIGYVVHKLPDGYWLIEFPQFQRMHKNRIEELTWYIHKNDLTIETITA
jgi:hypothetical protein